MSRSPLPPDTPDPAPPTRAADDTADDPPADPGRVTAELHAALAGNGPLVVAVNSVSLGVVIVDTQAPDWPIIFVNPAFVAMNGYTREEAIGRNCRFMQGPATDRAMVARIRAAIHAGQPFRGTLLNYRRDGSPFWNELTVSPVRHGDDAVFPQLFIGLQEDVTERKHNEAALRDSEARNAAVLQTALDAIVTMDAAGRVIEFNPAAEAMFGHRREDMIGQPLHERIIPPEFHAAHLRGLAAYLATGRVSLLSRRVEVPALRADGTRLLVELGLTRIPVPGPPLFTAYLRDLTETRRNEQTMRENQDRIERVAANIPGMVYQFVRRADGSMHFPYVSEGCREICGLDPAVIRHDPAAILDMIEPAEREGFMTSITVSADTLRAWRWEGVIRSPRDGRPQHLLATSRPVRLENGDTVWDGVVLDVTERKQHDELRLAKEAAERANRAKSEFLSRMSHELRTPLNAILGFGQLLEMDPLAPLHAQSVEHIMRAGRHLLALIDEVLDISRLESGRLGLLPATVALGPLLRDTLDSIRPLAAGRGLRLLDAGLAPGRDSLVRADPHRLKQILLNLLSNAVKYNRPGGEIELACTRVPSAAGAGPGRVRLTVRDTGPGITPGELARLFVPFERLAAAASGVEGTGLGLAVSRSLAEAMGGELNVESVPGVGSTFWLELPRAPAADPSAPDRDPRPRDPAPVGRRLLYIEDEPSNLELVRGILDHQRGHWELLTAPDGPRGLALAQNDPLPDLILLDLQLPGMVGDDVLARLRADPRTHPVPVILLSADANPESRLRLLAAGAHAYLTKPLDVCEFLEAVDEALRVG